MRQLKPKEQTRADYFGINANQLSRTTNTKIERVRARIEQIQEPWLDVDQSITDAVDEVLASLNKLKQVVTETAVYLNEPFE